MRRASRGAGVAAAVAAALCMSPAARADVPVDTRISYVVDAVEPRVTGVTVHVEAPVLSTFPPLTQVDDTTKFDLTIFDPAGAPLLRTGPHGSYGNTSSLYYKAATNPAVAGVVPSSSPSSRTTWRRIGSTHSLRYYDPRTVLRARLPDDQSVASILQSFAIPVMIRGVRATIRGHVQFTPILGSVKPEIVSFSPTISGVSVRAAPGAVPLVEVTNRSRTTIEVTGRDGAPFARVGPAGVVVNVNSATWHDTHVAPPATGAAPKWSTIQVTPILAWLEKRAAFAGPVPDAVARAHKRALLSRWTVTGLAGGRRFTIHGADYWEPLAATPAAAKRGHDGDSVIAAIVGVAVVIAALAALAFIRRTEPSK